MKGFEEFEGFEGFEGFERFEGLEGFEGFEGVRDKREKPLTFDLRPLTLALTSLHIRPGYRPWPLTSAMSAVLQHRHPTVSCVA